MIVFTLSMPHAASWNGRWSGEGSVYAKGMKEREVKKDLWDKDFYYSWNDGWTACVSVRRVHAKEANKIIRKSRGFCGYDWMIRSILERGYIISPSDLARESKKEEVH